MKPSDHLAYIGEHPTIKGQDRPKKMYVPLASAIILSNFADKYDSGAKTQAMAELDITRSILESLEMNKEAEYIESIYNYIENKYFNPTK